MRAMRITRVGGTVTDGPPPTRSPGVGRQSPIPRKPLLRSRRAVIALTMCIAGAAAVTVTVWEFAPGGVQAEVVARYPDHAASSWFS